MREQRHWGIILVATDVVQAFEEYLPAEHRLIATRRLDDGVDECIISGPDMPLIEDGMPLPRTSMFHGEDETGKYYFWAHLGPLHRWRVG